MDDEIAILICGSPDFVSDPVPGSVTTFCGGCGCAILRAPDPEVPQNALCLCLPCGIKHMDDSTEVPEIHITKQNEEYLHSRGYRLKPAEGNC